MYWLIPIHFYHKKLIIAICQYIYYYIISGNASFIENQLIQKSNISVSIVKNLNIRYPFTFFSVYHEPKSISNIVHVST